MAHTEIHFCCACNYCCFLGPDLDSRHRFCKCPNPAQAPCPYPARGAKHNHPTLPTATKKHQTLSINSDRNRAENSRPPRTKDTMANNPYAGYCLLSLRKMLWEIRRRHHCLRPQNQIRRCLCRRRQKLPLRYRNDHPRLQQLTACDGP